MIVSRPWPFHRKPRAWTPLEGRTGKRSRERRTMTGFHGPSLGPFQWDDPLLLESQLTEDERLIRDTAREFAAKELRPRIEKAYLEEKTDPALFRLMGDAGLLGVTLPEEFGCAGAGYVSYGLVAREVERVDSGFRSM